MKAWQIDMHQPTREQEGVACAVRVLAGPEGFAGCAYTLAIGPLRATAEQARADAAAMADMIDCGGFSGAVHAMRVLA